MSFPRDDDAKDAKPDGLYTTPSIPSVKELETLDLFEDSIDPVYQAKARILNHAIQEIGMGKYQVRLCVLVDQGRNHSHDAFPRSVADLVVPVHRCWLRVVLVSTPSSFVLVCAS